MKVLVWVLLLSLAFAKEKEEEKKKVRHGFSEKELVTERDLIGCILISNAELTENFSELDRLIPIDAGEQELQEVLMVITQYGVKNCMAKTDKDIIQQAVDTLSSSD